jgi:hypothetical protein
VPGWLQTPPMPEHAWAHLPPLHVSGFVRSTQQSASVVHASPATWQVGVPESQTLEVEPGL